MSRSDNPGADRPQPRTGPFWDGVNGWAPVPPAARTLGFEFVDFDPDDAVITLAFTAGENLTNPNGNVLGAFLAAMLFDTVGPALLATLAPDEFQSTQELTVRFLRPVRPGRLRAVGRVVERQGDRAQLEATLLDDQDNTVATATAFAVVVPLRTAATAP
ncbi:PaaI family thioesterase [Kribbella sp. CA-247076]|uniref:PaaI family thioesterase n=1 Tax=Kribbella sp. CA-247076 TaxID=3239941 RepID=UPI003D8F8371